MTTSLKASQLGPSMIVRAPCLAHPSDLTVVSNLPTPEKDKPKWNEYSHVITFQDESEGRLHWHYTPGRREDEPVWELVGGVQ